MKTRATAFMRVSFVVLFFMGMFLSAWAPGVSAADRRRDRCKRRCEEVFDRRKRECKRYRGREKHRCEDDAKRDRNQCKDGCR
jgi:hypothetical protein